MPDQQKRILENPETKEIWLQKKTQKRTYGECCEIEKLKEKSKSVERVESEAQDGREKGQDLEDTGRCRAHGKAPLQPKLKNQQRIVWWIHPREDCIFGKVGHVRASRRRWEEMEN